MKKIGEAIPGSQINKITTVRTVKGIVIDLFRGYPDSLYWGIIEGRWDGDFERGKRIVGILKNDGIIETGLLKDETGKSVECYRLTPKGIDLAISMINLDYGDKTLKYSKEMRKFTISVIVLEILTLILSGVTLYFG